MVPFNWVTELSDYCLLYTHFNENLRSFKRTNYFVEKLITINKTSMRLGKIDQEESKNYGPQTLESIF